MEMTDPRGPGGALYDFTRRYGRSPTVAEFRAAMGHDVRLPKGSPEHTYCAQCGAPATLHEHGEVAHEDGTGLCTREG